MKFGDSMTEAKLIVEERLMNDHNRTLPAKDVVVERTRIGQPTDRISLALAIARLIPSFRHAHETDEECRSMIEEGMRRGSIFNTTHASYRVAPSQVVPDWTPAPEVAP